jgi:hypothetical protein
MPPATGGSSPGAESVEPDDHSAVGSDNEGQQQAAAAAAATPSPSKFCTNCGAALGAPEAFCSGCGSPTASDLIVASDDSGGSFAYEEVDAEFDFDSSVRAPRSYGSVAFSLCTTVQTLYPRSTRQFGSSFSERQCDQTLAVQPCKAAVARARLSRRAVQDAPGLPRGGSAETEDWETSMQMLGRTVDARGGVGARPPAQDDHVGGRAHVEHERHEQPVELLEHVEHEEHAQHAVPRGEARPEPVWTVDGLSPRAYASRHGLTLEEHSPRKVKFTGLTQNSQVDPEV